MATVGRQLMPNIQMPRQPAISDADFLPQEAYTAPQYPNRIQEGISQGILEAPRADRPDEQMTAQQWYDMRNGQPSQKKRKSPYDTLQRIGIGMRAARTGLGWLSGIIERGRQNQYDYMQQTALGQMNPMPPDQPQGGGVNYYAQQGGMNPFSYYSKYGGNLKKIVKEWTNRAKFDFGSGDDDQGLMQQGGSLNPPKGSSLVKDPMIGTQSYYDYNRYYPMVTYPGDTLTNSQLNEAARRKLVSATGDKNYIVTKTENTDNNPMSLYDTRYMYKLADKDIRKVDSVINNMSSWEKFRKATSNIANSELPSPDLIPEQVDRFRAFPVSKRPMKHGGNMQMEPYHNLSKEQYKMMLQHLQAQAVPGFHMMPDGTMMPDSEMDYDDEMKKGGYEIDRMLITRKFLPELLRFGYLGTNKYRRMQQGGTYASLYGQQANDMLLRDREKIRGILGRRGDPNAQTAYGALSINDPILKFTGDTPPPNPIPLATSLPAGITPNMVENTTEGYGYYHPQEGTFIKVNPQAIFPATATIPKPSPANLMAKLRKGGIHIKPENRGKFTEYCGGKVTEDCIQKALNSPSATIRKRANFARNARKWNK